MKLVVFFISSLLMSVAHAELSPNTSVETSKIQYSAPFRIAAYAATEDDYTVLVQPGDEYVLTLLKNGTTAVVKAALSWNLQKMGISPATFYTIAYLPENVIPYAPPCLGADMVNTNLDNPADDNGICYKIIDFYLSQSPE